MRAIVMVMVIAGSLSVAEWARADEAGEPAVDLLALLSASPQAQAVLAARLDTSVQLQAAPASVPPDLQTRVNAASSTLGIGQLGEQLADAAGLPSIYARHDTPAPLPGDPTRARAAAQQLAAMTREVSDCYGEPLRDGVATDSLGVLLSVDAKGAVTAARVLKSTVYGSPNTEECVLAQLSRRTFPTGAARLDVAHVWNIRLNGGQSFRFD